MVVLYPPLKFGGWSQTQVRVLCVLLFSCICSELVYTHSAPYHSSYCTSASGETVLFSKVFVGETILSQTCSGDAGWHEGAQLWLTFVCIWPWHCSKFVWVSLGKANCNRVSLPSLLINSLHGWNFVHVTVFQRCSSSRLSCPNLCVYTHAQEWSHTHIKNPVVYVRVRWITKTWTDPACTLLTGG